MAKGTLLVNMDGNSFNIIGISDTRLLPQFQSAVDGSMTMTASGIGLMVGVHDHIMAVILAEPLGGVLVRQRLKEASAAARAEPKCSNKAFLRLAPIPGISSRRLVNIAFSRRFRCEPIAKR